MSSFNNNTTTATTQPGSGAAHSANAGASTGDKIKQGASKIHGIGEALRGNVNSFADEVTNTDSTASQAVADRGEREFATGKYEGSGAGVTPHDTTRERVNRDVQGEGNKFTHGV